MRGRCVTTALLGKIKIQEPDGPTKGGSSKRTVKTQSKVHWARMELLDQLQLGPDEILVARLVHGQLGSDRLV